MKLTNNHGISLPLAVWLLHDDYDYINEPNYISVTKLLKSIKQLVLARRVETSDLEIDISAYLAKRLGQATHDSIESAWRRGATSAMTRLGYPAKIADNVVVNPSPEELAANQDIIPIWFEQRAIREIAGYKVGGKFDTVIDGRLFDYKTTSVWSYMIGGKDEDYSMQGGIYRWLNPELITSDHVYIQFVFTDWQRRDAKRNPNYPQVKSKEYPVALPSIADTERFLTAKLNELSRCWNLPEDQLPPCTDKELWRSKNTYKYYANPLKTDGRSTKNFDDLAEANEFKASNGGKGVVIIQAGEVKACEYCDAFPVCKQKDLYYGD